MSAHRSVALPFPLGGAREDGRGLLRERYVILSVALRLPPFIERLFLLCAHRPKLSRGNPFPPKIIRTRAYNGGGKSGSTNARLPSGNVRTSYGMNRHSSSRRMAMASRQDTIKYTDDHAPFRIPYHAVLGQKKNAPVRSLSVNERPRSRGVSVIRFYPYPHACHRRILPPAHTRRPIQVR